MEEKPRSATVHGMYYGLITGVALVIFSLILFIADLYMNRYVSSISYLFLIAGMVYGALEYRKKYRNGVMTYSQAFSSCFMIGLFAGVVAAIYAYIFAQFIHPAFVQEILEQSREKMMTQNPNMSEEQMEVAMQWTSKFTTPVMMMVWGFVAYVFISAIISLIAAIFVKKEAVVSV
jgi:hypothetical protein